MFNCEEIVELYLLETNPLYNYRFGISILASIASYGYIKSNNICKNSYINQILITISVLFMTMIFIHILAQLMITNKRKQTLIQKCKLYIAETNNIIGGTIDMKAVEVYDGKLAKYTVDNKGAQHAPEVNVKELTKIDGENPGDLLVKNDNNGVPLDFSLEVPVNPNIYNDSMATIYKNQTEQIRPSNESSLNDNMATLDNSFNQQYKWI